MNLCLYLSSLQAVPNSYLIILYDLLFLRLTRFLKNPKNKTYVRLLDKSLELLAMNPGKNSYQDLIKVTQDLTRSAEFL